MGQLGLSAEGEDWSPLKKPLSLSPSFPSYSPQAASLSVGATHTQGRASLPSESRSRTHRPAGTVRWAFLAQGFTALGWATEDSRRSPGDADLAVLSEPPPLTRHRCRPLAHCPLPEVQLFLSFSLFLLTVGVGPEFTMQGADRCQESVCVTLDSHQERQSTRCLAIITQNSTLKPREAQPFKVPGDCGWLEAAPRLGLGKLSPVTQQPHDSSGHLPGDTLVPGPSTMESLALPRIRRPLLSM